MKIGVAAISGAVNRKNNEAGEKYLKSLGYDVETSENLYSRKNYLAGDDKTRLNSFNEFLKKDDIEVLVFARGGYGCIRILEYLNLIPLEKNNKIIMGYSDNSIILNHIYEKIGLKTIHGPNISQIEKLDEKKINEIFSGIFKGSLFNDFYFLNPGRAKGILKGGNLASLASLCGTGYMPDFSDSVLFIEDINESPYKIDKYLCQMRLSGALNKIKAVIAGEFLNCGDIEIINEILNEYFPMIPIVKTNDFGHGDKNIPLLIGGEVEIDSKGDIVVYG